MGRAWYAAEVARGWSPSARRDNAPTFRPEEAAALNKRHPDPPVRWGRIHLDGAEPHAVAELVNADVDVRRASRLVDRPRSTHYWRARPSRS